MKKILFILLFLLLFNPFYIFSQDIANSKEKKSELEKICIAYVDEDKDSFSEEQANKILEIILSTIGASKRFVLKPCQNTANASANTKKGIRYIFYNKEFMKQINSNINYWFNMWVLSHEIGHHINGHVLTPDISIQDRRMEELEADKFGGFVLGKLGATLYQAYEVINKLKPRERDNIYSKYPSKSKRIDAVNQGFNNALGIPTFYKKTLLNSAEEYFYSAYEKGIYKDYYGAIIDYSKAIELNPNYTIAYYNRGVIKNELKDYKRAIDDYTKAIELNPNYAIAYYNRGLIKDNLGDRYGAIVDYSKSIEIHPNDPAAFYNRGIIKFDLEKYYEAITDYTEAIQLNPNYAKAYHNIGVVKNKLKNYKSAIEDYTKAIELDPDVVPYNNRGIAKNNLEDYDGAITDYSKAIEMDSSYAYAYANRGISKYYIGDMNGACADWVKAANLSDEQAKKWVADKCK